MNEVRVFLELIKLDNGKIMFSTGGGICNDGQMESHDNLADAIRDLNERVVVEYERLRKWKWHSIQESEVEQMNKIPMYEIRSKKNRGHVFMFQNEDGTQKPAKYLFKDSAEKMLAILNKDCNQYYIVLA